MTVDHREYNKEISPLYVAVLNITVILEELSDQLGTHRCVPDLTNAFFSTDIALENSDPFAFMWESGQ